MKRLSLFFFYLLILFLPVQLGRHFFFDFTAISGIRSDYLTPTVYFTDIIAGLLIISEFIGKLKSKPEEKPSGWKTILFISTCYFLFNALFVAANKWAAFYKLAKIFEFILLTISISRLKSGLKTIAALLSVTVFYSSFIAVWQFLIQKSIGGAFWFLGERTFYADTPSIAAFSYKGSLLLRPYATFPHPNVLGGYLSVILPLVVFYLVSRRAKMSYFSKLWFAISFILGTAALILSFSRLAWGVALVGLVLVILERKKYLLAKLQSQKEKILVIFYSLILLSVVIPLSPFTNFQPKYGYWQERVSLLKITIPMVSSNWLFGVGLNNFITQAQNYTKGFPGLYIFQPVHNIYLLVFAETGVIGFLLFILLTIWTINRLLKSKSIILFSLMQLFILGLFDHYLVTLQQGELLFVIFTALSFAPKMAY